MIVKIASEAISMIEKQKDIRLVIANIEIPHIDSDSFLTTLLHKDIPLIRKSISTHPYYFSYFHHHLLLEKLICLLFHFLSIKVISPEIMTKKVSDSVTKASRFCLKKPIFENDIKNLWQHVLPKKSQVFEKINIVEKQKSVMNKDIMQIEAFRETIKRQRTGQASLLGRQKFMKTFEVSEMYQKRKSVANAEWKTKPVCSIEIENKKREWKKVESNVGRRCNLWTYERHMKFLAAISILGEKSKIYIPFLTIYNLCFYNFLYSFFSQDLVPNQY